MGRREGEKKKRERETNHKRLLRIENKMRVERGKWALVVWSSGCYMKWTIHYMLTNENWKFYEKKKIIIAWFLDFLKSANHQYQRKSPRDCSLRGLRWSKQQSHLVIEGHIADGIEQKHRTRKQNEGVSQDYHSPQYLHQTLPFWHVVTHSRVS